MSEIALSERRIGLGTTGRTDAWWLQPAAVVVGLLLFIVYSAWAAFQGNYYFAEPYVSPFYSPLLFVKVGIPGGAPLSHSLLGVWPHWWPGFIPASPSLLILIFPLAFRFTCYFFRRTYYRGFAATPPACAVHPIPRKNYRGETGILVFENLHRYALYFIILFIIVHLYDTVGAFIYHGKFGVGVGSIVLALDTVLLSCYVFGCHSLRHLIGGGRDCLSCSGLRYGTWTKVSWLNKHHGLFGWTSLLWVALSDLYVRLVSMGVVQDWNTWGI